VFSSQIHIEKVDSALWILVYQARRRKQAALGAKSPSTGLKSRCAVSGASHPDQRYQTTGIDFLEVDSI